MRILRLMLQTPIADHHSSRDKALDREYGSQLLVVQCKNDAIVIRGFHDVAIDTSAETRKLEGKLDTLVNFQSGVDEHPEFSARNDVIVIRGVHDVATDTSAEARKLEGKLDVVVNLVTQLAANQKPAYVARVCGIHSSIDHHTSVCPSSQQSGVDDHPEAYAANTYSRLPQQGVHDVATDTSAETRKLEGKLDALVNLVTQLATNEKPASVARVCGMRSSNDHHISQLSGRNDAIAIRGVHDVATDTSAETRKLEGKLDALVNLVTQLAANQKPLYVVTVFGISSSNDHHTSVCPSSQQSGVDEHPEAYATNTIETTHRERDKALDREDGSQLLTIQCKK
ncbi:hypothetical protein Fmac_028586 [Flemingia macrophylla]|uniref:Uncharacterized protein n=1 Tax=Flemingia macrophylla TaxID=520843 RepID=A0ABD1L7W6_9FABA